MRKEGIALVSVLVAMVAVLLMALGMSYMAETNLSTGRNLAQQAVARQRAEAGVDHALAYLKRYRQPTEIRGDGYTVTIAQLPDSGFRVESTGTFGPAKHVAVAIVQLQSGPTHQPHPLFGQGWISGGRITINGGVDLHASRLHADGGYASLSGPIRICDENGNNCRNLSQLSPLPITGGEGVTNAQCNASGQNSQVCESGRPKYRVCPVYQNPSDPNLTCLDLLSGQPTRWDQAYRITQPEVSTLSEASMGVRVTSVLTDARTKELCQVSFTSLDPGRVEELLGFLRSQGVSPLTENANDLLLLVLPQLANKRVCVTYNVTLPANSVLRNVTFYVGGTFQVNGPVTLNGVRVAAQGGLNLDSVQATDSKFYTAGNINLNNNATFAGDSTLASSQSITFNGRADLVNNRALAIISERDIIFNGRADTHAFMWSGGQITFNGTGTFIGGAVSIGGTIRNGGGQFSIRNSSAQNSDLPQVGVDSDLSPRVVFRR